MPQAPPSEAVSPTGHRGVDGRGEVLLRDALGGEQAAVGEHRVQSYAFVLRQHVHPDPQGGQRREQLGAHEGGQVEGAVGGTQEQRPTLRRAR